MKRVVLAGALHIWKGTQAAGKSLLHLQLRQMLSLPDNKRSITDEPGKHQQSMSCIGK